MGRKIGVTGTRRGMTHSQRIAWEAFIKPEDEIHFGDCIGADEEALYIAHVVGCKTVGHPPLDDSRRCFGEYDEIRPQKDFLERNKDIVDETAILVAFPGTTTEELRSGTWMTIRYAKRKQKKVEIIFPQPREVEG